MFETDDPLVLARTPPAIVELMADSALPAEIDESAPNATERLARPETVLRTLSCCVLVMADGLLATTAEIEPAEASTARAEAGIVVEKVMAVR